MSLARAERRRLFKRRFTRYMLVIVLLVLAAVAGATFFSNQKVGPDQIAAAQRAAERDYQQQLRDHQDFLRQCEEANRTGANTGGQYPQNCAEVQGPRREDFDLEWYMPATFDFHTDFEPTITVLASVLALFAFVVGASYVGAEWSSGGMMNLLLWRPRRLNVLLTKLGTLIAAVVTLTVGLAAVWTAAFWGIATQRGNTDKMTAGAWQSLGLTGLRGLGLVLVAAILGFGLASVGRHTALALGTAVGVAVVGYVGVAIALAMIDVRFVDRWLWTTYLQAWMGKKLTLEDYDACEFVAGECRPKQLVIDWHQSGLLFGVVTAVVLAVTMWTMRRRDIA